MKLSNLIAVGLAIFAMLFGSGNVVFPLALGRDAGDSIALAMAGFVLTGVIVPLIGLVAAALFEGDYRKFLGMAGRWPGALMTFLCMMLIGPLGTTPRCITLAHGALRWHLPSVNLVVFSIVAAVLIYLTTVRRSYVVELMGRVFGPIKLTLLLTMIVVGVFAAGALAPAQVAPGALFMRGFADGYQTMDLMATIFFSGLIIAAIKQRLGSRVADGRSLARYGLQAGLIGGTLLGVVYIGFGLTAAKHGAALAFTDKTQLLSALANIILGAHATILANLTTTIACLTTAIALTTVFANYLATELLGGKIKYHHALVMTVAVNLAMTNLGFNGIAHIVEPVVFVCYPALIVLSLANIAYVLWGFRYVQLVTLATLAFNVLISARHLL